MLKPSIIALLLLFGALCVSSSLSAQVKNGTYYIRSAVGRYLDVQWGNANAGTPMHLWDFNGGVAQKWIIKKTPQGFYTIQSDLGRYLDVDNGRADAGTKVHLWDYNGGVAQQWYFTRWREVFILIHTRW
jgi:hypothetical protein